MKKRIIILLILIMLILVSTISLADSSKSIIIVLDEMSINLAEELAEEKSAIGLINLKTRDKLSEENLYLSINKGRKLGSSDLKDLKKLESLGDILKKEKTSYMGNGKEDIILWDKDNKVDFEKNAMTYDLEWLIKNTNMLLKKSDILAIGYNFQNKEERVDILKDFLKYYNNEQIIMLPKSISKKNKSLLNNSLVPIIYMSDNENSAILTSDSTKREGFIVIEDITTQIKSTYGHYNKADIGNNFNLIEKEDKIKNFNSIYKTTINLLILIYIFHGFIYTSQGLLGFSILKNKKISSWIYSIYLFSTTNIIVSLILGLFELHENIYIYLIISLILSFIVALKVKKKNKEKNLILASYLLIVLGSLFYPKMIYDSYIGFNNLSYGARYYGLNNGIMGVLLASSILSFFIIVKKTNNIRMKKFLGILIFGLNMLVLSTKFGTNTGGFITSIVLFILVMYMILFNKENNFRKTIMFIIIAISIFTLNMLMDNMSAERSHGIQFFYRLKNNGFKEFIYMASFKARELIILTLTPPFSIVIICQLFILKKIKGKLVDNEKFKQEAKLILVTSLVGFFINDTGMIMLIYMLNYFILYLISNRKFQE